MRRICTAAFLLLGFLHLAAQAQPGISLVRLFASPTTPVVMHIETINLSTVTPTSGGSSSTFTYKLQAAPVTSMGCIVHLASSQAGGDVFTAAPLDSTASIMFTMPNYPVTSADIVTVVYWSAK